MANRRRRSDKWAVHRRHRLAATTFVATLLWWAPEASAQSGSRDVPLGGRTATMGGAATAAGNDSSMPYLNPAGLAGLPADVLAVSASALAFSARSFRGPVLTLNASRPAVDARCAAQCF